jgi:two-component system, chemotaxis family, chemotaxis protein CheY
LPWLGACRPRLAPKVVLTMLRILLVEDSASMRRFARTALETVRPALGDLEVVEATSGFDALRWLPRGRYDLVVTDINMPDVNGLELVRFIRQSPVHGAVPIVLISTQSSERDRERGLGLGANAYLVKPFAAEDLAREAIQQIASASNHHG